MLRRKASVLLTGIVACVGCGTAALPLPSNQKPADSQTQAPGPPGGQVAVTPQAPGAPSAAPANPAPPAGSPITPVSATVPAAPPAAAPSATPGAIPPATTATPAIPTASADELRRRATDATKSNRLDDAAAALKDLIVVDPNDRKARVDLITVYYRQTMTLAKTDHPKALEASLNAAAVLKDFQAKFAPLSDVEKRMASSILYNEACAEANRGNKERAIAALNEAVEFGYTNTTEMKTDPDLASVRDLPEFASILKAIDDKSKEHARSLIASSELFPFSFSLPDLKGKKISLKQYKGKVVVVDFWGTWCPPCRKEIPHFVELQDKYKDDLQVVGLTYENGAAKDKIAKIRDFATKEKINYPCLLGDDKTQKLVPEFRGYPTTLFIDRTGKVRAKVVGYHSMADLEAMIQVLMDEKDPS